MAEQVLDWDERVMSGEEDFSAHDADLYAELSIVIDARRDHINTATQALLSAKIHCLEVATSIDEPTDLNELKMDAEIAEITKARENLKRCVEDFIHFEDLRAVVTYGKWYARKYVPFLVPKVGGQALLADAFKQSKVPVPRVLLRSAVPGPEAGA